MINKTLLLSNENKLSVIRNSILDTGAVLSYHLQEGCLESSPYSYYLRGIQYYRKLSNSR